MKKDYHCIRFCQFSIGLLKIQPKQVLDSPIQLELGQVLMLIMMHMMRGLSTQQDHSMDEHM